MYMYVFEMNLIIWNLLGIIYNTLSTMEKVASKITSKL